MLCRSNRRLIPIFSMLLLIGACCVSNSSAHDADAELTSVGPIAFGPSGLLLVSDPMAATIYAVETGDTDGTTEGVVVEVEDVRAKVASMMGADKKEVQINDLAINPINGHAYLSVTRRTSSEAVAAILMLDPKSGAMKEFDLKGKKASKVVLSNAADNKKNRRGRNQRLESITDMAFVDGQVYVAGLSNEEFASKLRAIPFPFKDSEQSVSIEIFHGAHGKFETRSPIRTFAAYMIEDEMNLLAAYTCTPLVRIPVGQLDPEQKVKGITIAELGNRNRPLDMVVYKKNGKDFALMANSSRGVMKIDLAKAGTQEGIEKRTGIAGIPYETVENMKGVMQLDGLSATHGVVLVRTESGQENLETIALP